MSRCTHNVSIDEVLVTLHGRPYTTHRLGTGATSLDHAEQVATVEIARLVRYNFGTYRAHIELFCRRCFPGGDYGVADAAKQAAVAACPCCHGTMLEPMYAPEWPAGLADERAAEIGLSLAKKARERAELRARIAADDAAMEGR